MKRRIRLRKELEQLGRAQRAECRPDNLRSERQISLSDIFASRDIHDIWLESEKEIKTFRIPDGTGGVNPGDRRAIYYLVSALKPVSVLEIGTHIGASTIHIASALRNSSGKNANLTTVDIVDVNSPIEKPWLRYGATHSPMEMTDGLGHGALVHFVTDTSLNCAAHCQSTFDFIFVDGDHSAATVYQEIAVALSLLRRNGVILLHDYFPDMKPLWSNGSVIPGPFLATEKLRGEGVKVTVLPLGALPWPTKLESRVTSLGLLVKDE
ncbi:MAG: class I SAM-dependent methyltransferase [Planctomycetes bacterium]|nr:class I SAM-dependent methyltransferase [Planctomycetota bacterium]